MTGDPNRPTDIPKPVVTAAVLFAVGSILPIVDIIGNAIRTGFQPGLQAVGILGVFVAWGLVTRRRIWFIVAVVLATLAVGANGFALYVTTLASGLTGRGTISLLQFSFEAPTWVFSSMILLNLALAAWQLWLLYSDDVRRFCSR